jgi:hypothetical protein
MGNFVQGRRLFQIQRLKFKKRVFELRNLMRTHWETIAKSNPKLKTQWLVEEDVNEAFRARLGLSITLS